ncbi:MAG: S41 family peptidase [Phycisphaerae bacterium]|nr:S41 family peptidase [Phycisphaerae bacterium]
MKLTRYALGLLAGLIIGSFIAGTCSAAASTRRTTPATHPPGPATQAVTAATRPATQTRPARVEDALAAAVKEALAGRFLQATKALRITAKAAPDNAAAAAALDLLDRHLSRSNRSRTEQRREYTEAVRRVRHGMLAEQYLPKLAKAKVDQKLRKKISAVVSAYGEIGSCEGLMDADTKAANKLCDEATRALEQTDAALKGTLKALKGDTSQYAKVLDGLVAALKRQLNACRQVWHDAKTDTAHERAETADKLKPLEDELALAVADLEVMTAMKPWRIALSQGRLAKQLAGKGEEYSRQEWYKSLLADSQAQANKAVADARWFDALMAYAGLEELLTGIDSKKEQFYKDKVKEARRHVRMLRLYGDEDESRTASKPTTGPSDTEATWHEMSAGIDAKMVKKAIEKLNDFYVVPVDYKKVSRGALLSVHVLGKTPQAAKSFPLLGDKDRQQRFVKAIEAQLAAIDRRNGVDQLDLSLALHTVLSVSEDTVKIPTRVLAMEFADGLLDELDRFSSMIWPDDVADFRKHTMGQFFGVGIQITKKPGEPLKVVTPLVGSPAFRAGIKAGDTIIAVDGRATEDRSVDRLVRMITGKKGTKVVLTISRPGLIKPMDKAIIRDEIHIRTVKGWRRIRNGKWDHCIDPKAKVGYIRISQFTDTTARDLAEALTKMQEGGMKSLVLDLRFNPGGLLRAATKVADQFLAGGRIVSTKGRQVRRTEVNASPSGKFLKGGLAVLINEHSASAAEIVAGAIKDWRRGLIVGQRTFGKGSVQNVIPIREQRSYLKLTTAYYYLPSGRQIHKQNASTDWGVVPDVEVTVTPRQMKHWLEIRRKTDLLKEVDQHLLKEAMAKQYDADLQLSSAVLLLKLKGLAG